MRKLKFLLIGAGSIGRRHLRLLLERHDVIMSVAEPFEAGRARVKSEYPGVSVYSSFEEALEQDSFDAAIIATPHGMHSEQAIRALEAGLHVFCEKPMSDSLEECVAMLRAAEKSDRVFSVGFMFRFDPFVLKVKELIEEGRIGNTVHYASRFATYNTLLCSVTKHQKDTPYSLIMDCIHDTDLLTYFLGRVPDRVFASAYQAGRLEFSSPQNVIDMLFGFDSRDLGAAIHFNYMEHPQVHALEIVGDRGYIQGDFMKPSITVGTLDGKVEKIDIVRDFDNVYRAEWDRFVRAVRGECKPENTARDAIFSTLLMQAERESAESGREVSIREVAARYSFEY